MAQLSQELYLGRQPILDRGERLFAYELLFRSGHHNFANVINHSWATATVISHVFTDLGLEAALGPYKGFINFGAAMLMNDAVELLPPERFVLEVLEHVEVTPELVARCRALKDKGFALALDDYVGRDQRYAPLLELADFVKVDLLSLAEDELVQVVNSLKHWPVKLLAEKVGNEAQHRHCIELGFEYFQGYYFARPAIISGKKLSHSELSLMRLLSLVLEGAETAKIESVFKQEPGLTLNLLRLTNSAASGVHEHITSLRHAITVLGRRQLQRWLQLLLYTQPGARAGGPLLALAATRGRLMECLAAHVNPAGEFADHAFMTGVMSLMPAVLGIPIEKVIEPLHVGGDIAEALTRRSGRLGALLSLAEKLDEDDADACAELAATLPGLTAETVNACLSQALAWASNISTAH